MTEPGITIADLERIQSIVPDLPLAKVIEMARWINEMRIPDGPAVSIVEGPETAAALCAQGSSVREIPNSDRPSGYAYSRPRPQPEFEPDAEADIPVFLKAVTQDPEPTPEPVEQAEEAPSSVPDRRGEPWTGEEEARALALRNRGFTVRQIADELGRPIPATGQKLKKLANPKPPKTPKARGRFAQPAPDPAQKQPHWTPDQVTKAKDGLAEGKPIEEVAAELKRTPLAVAAKLKRSEPEGDPQLTTAQREVLKRLEALDDDFTPEDDEYLCDGIVGRTPLGVIADQLGCDVATVKARWAAIVGLDPADLRKGVPIDLQTNTLAMVRYRAKAAT
ncbi:MAG: hypothetical protein ACU0FT_08070 [Paracoccus sp. (in: a-proteobacteria)]|uniref:hypothetical protein n=1 Tax=Paracoccus sp. TaxID=267 RepID=UPI004059137C